MGGTDYYRYVFQIKHEKFSITAIGDKKSFKNFTLHQHAPTDQDPHNWIRLEVSNPKKAKKIFKKIISGRIKLEYTGGHDTYGNSWGPDDMEE